MDRATETLRTQKIYVKTILQLLLENLGEKGLPSADRNNKATLLLTGPFRTSKSSAKDSFPRELKLQYAKYHQTLQVRWKNRLLRHEAEAYSCPPKRAGISSLSGMDSDLEAFSHYPADGSFAALPCRTAAKTNYLNQRFLSY